jgi:transposase
MPQMSQVLRERAVGMLTAGTRAVAREFDVNFTTISHFQRRFRDFGRMSNWPHNRRPRMSSCGGAVCGRQLCEQSAPWWWDYGKGRHKLWTTNTLAFYRLQFERTAIP